MKILIFGAQGIALGVCKALQAFNGAGKVFGAVVTDVGCNPKSLNDLPVFALDRLRDCLVGADWQSVEFFIATPENIKPEIERSLEERGFRRYHRVTSEEYATLMELYYARCGTFPLLRALPVCNSKPFLCCLVAQSAADKPLRSNIHYEDWMEPIQVGASLADRITANLRDDMGENISYKNRNYSELTALYWLWKNRLQSEGGKHIYYGLMQYRRRLMISKDDLYRLEANEVDVVLPYPMIYEPNIYVHPRRYLKGEDWQALLTALKELCPDYAEAFPNVLAQPYFYNYNIILARKTVLADYCSWLFPVLERVEGLSNPKGKDRADRYIGYMGEVLETLYFMYHKADLHIVHTGCKFYV